MASFIPIELEITILVSLVLFLPSAPDPARRLDRRAEFVASVGVVSGNSLFAAPIVSGQSRYASAAAGTIASVT
jgi:hypothetical protein